MKAFDALPDGHIGDGWQLVEQSPARPRGMALTYRFADGSVRSIVVPLDQYNEGTIVGVGDYLASRQRRAFPIVGGE